MEWSGICDTEKVILKNSFLKLVKKKCGKDLEFFLEKLLPIAEENNVSLAAHPNDPPMHTMRRTARILKNPSEYIKLINISKSPSNKIEMCLGSIQEMEESGL